ncbi:MAG: septation regulator SpoVG [Candidatus Coatesbacteria bacterium]|nr:septation regulator SpoVG [Candidatus Coatesbacteria bacterium]
MEITEIKITPLANQRIKAYVAITFDNAFVIKSMRLMEGQKGLYLRMPSRKRPTGVYQDIAHPINNEMRQKMEKAVIDAYQDKIANEVTPSEKTTDM